MKSTGPNPSSGFFSANFGAKSLVLTISLVLFISPSRGLSSASQICDSAALVAANRTGVPLSVLQAISLTETGRKNEGKFQPWPWTVNMEGKGVWFDTRDEAHSFVKRNFQRGARSFDIGCFQLNYKWHGQGFSSIEEMFDPNANALYAAKFLQELYIEKGNWTDAAGAYHSRTPKYADKYKARFVQLLAGLGVKSLPVVNPQPTVNSTNVQSLTPVIRVNNFPLLLRGTSGAASLGSLMPASAGMGAARLIGGS